MLVFENLAHRERAWATFYTDPDGPPGRTACTRTASR